MVVQGEESERDAKVFYKLHVRLTQHALVGMSRRACVIKLACETRYLSLFARLWRFQVIIHCQDTLEAKFSLHFRRTYKVLQILKYLYIANTSFIVS